MSFTEYIWSGREFIRRALRILNRTRYEATQDRRACLERYGYTFAAWVCDADYCAIREYLDCVHAAEKEVLRAALVNRLV